MENNRRRRFITAYIWMFGGTKAQAQAVYKRESAAYIDAVIAGFSENARRAFYED